MGCACSSCKRRAISGHSDAWKSSHVRWFYLCSRGEPEPGTGKVEGAGKRGEGMGKWGDIVRGVVVGELVGAQGVLSAQRLVEVGASGANNGKECSCFGKNS